MQDSENPTLMRRTMLAFLAAPLAGCSGTRVLDAVVPRSSYRGQADIAYGPDPRQRLDVYQPLAAKGATPLVVFFYGGSWTRGSRADYRFAGEALAASGITCIVADYRLSPQVHYPVFLQDCAQAVKWAFANASALGADPGRLFVMGHSAGAYNAAMLALDERWLAEAGVSTSQLAGWIGLAGPYDFLPIVDPEVQVAFDWPGTSAQTQPLAHVHAGAPPTLLLAAATDTVVNPQRSTVGLARALEAAHVPVRMQLYGRVNHVTLAAALAGPLKWLAPVRQDVVAFVLGPPARPA